MQQLTLLRLFKNPTPQQVVLLSAISGTIATTIGLSLIGFVFFPGMDWWLLLIVALIGFAAFYASFFYFLKIYIYRNLKMIFKNIHKQKLSLAEKKELVDMNSLVLDKAKKKVKDWSALEEKELDKLQSWQEYRRKFLGDISHELKTPIFNIQGYIETLLEEGLNDRALGTNFLQKAAKNVDRLNTIVQDLETISRLESGQLILDLQVFNVRELALEVLEDNELKAGLRNIKLMLKPGADLSYNVRADRDYLRQVLMNLISNSIKYGVENGITKVSFYDMDSYILLEVSDDGIGIDSEHLGHVFDRFYRVDKSRSREQGGSGLGLSIVKHIIEAHKQTIHVRSKPGVGSTFGFTIEKAD